MRIVEAIIACGLILISHYVISLSTASLSSSETIDVDLEDVGRNLLNTLEDQELLLSVLTNEKNWQYNLRKIIESMIPSDILYNISFASLVTGEPLASDITNMVSSETPPDSSMSSLQGVYPISYPVVEKTNVLLDIVLVFDRSGSMDDPIPGDPYDKIYYAKDAACSFIDRLNTSDRVGLAAFSTTAIVDPTLTYDHEYVKVKINNLTPSGYTNMGDGIDLANNQYETLGSDNATWVIILLSDGIANRPNNEEYAREYALNKSYIAQDMGVLIYTIGLGGKEDIDEDLLREIQNQAYYYAPSAKELDEIWDAIADDLIFEVRYDIIYIQIQLMKP
jgi:hypothetical protein